MTTTMINKSGPRPYLVVSLPLELSIMITMSLLCQTASAVETFSPTTPAITSKANPDPTAVLANERPFIITRTFDAPRSLVFKSWTERERLRHWFGPSGLTFISATNDLRPGGTCHFCMRDSDGTDFWGRWVYRDIAPPERLVYVDSFSDKSGGVTRHPSFATWPLETLTTLTLTETGGKTALTLEWIPINPTPIEYTTFEGAFPGMTRGWGGTFDRLSGYLASIDSASSAANPISPHP